MADLATPSGAAMFDGGAGDKKKTVEKVEKPDEKVYNEALKKAEKEHSDSMAKLVRCILFCLRLMNCMCSVPLLSPTYINKH